MTDKILAFKGFDKDLKCRDYQYEIGKEFVHTGDVKPCNSGFHSCEHPLDVFNYYPPSDSRFAIVDVYGEISKESNGDSKIASSKLYIKAEIKIPDLVEYAVNYIIDKLDKTLTSTNTGTRSASTNTGDYSASTNTGDYSASTNTGTRSASTNTGDYSASTNTGKNSVALNCGHNGKARSCIGSAIVLCYYDSDNEYKLTHIKSAIVDGIILKENVFYQLDSNGEFVEVE